MNSDFNFIPDWEALKANTARTATVNCTLEEGTVENFFDLNIEEPKEEIPWRDIRIDKSYDGISPTLMRLVHLPTGYFTQGQHISQRFLRVMLYKKLCAIVKEKNGQ